MGRMRADNAGHGQKTRDSFFIKSDNTNTKSDYKNNLRRVSKDKINSKFSKIKSDSQEASTSESVKKPFDKKKWRTKKYSNKYKIEQWEDKRKKAILRSYYKELKQSQSSHKPTTETDKSLGQSRQAEDNDPKLSQALQIRKKDSTFKKAHLEFLRIKEEKKKGKEEALKNKEEKKKAIEMSRKKKLEKFKRLNKRNKKGQPIMKDRIELLLEKLQNNINC